MERPVLFNSAMVRAILDGRKTQTRRVVKWKPREGCSDPNWYGYEAGYYNTANPESGYVLRNRSGGVWNDKTFPALCPFGKPGDRLWVRETWYCDHIDERNYNSTKKLIQPPRTNEACEAEWRGPNNENMYYRADVPSGRFEDAGYWAEPGSYWKSSIHMPRWASRITLEIKNVRVERLQDISEEDALREGIKQVGNCSPPNYSKTDKCFFNGSAVGFKTAIEAFTGLWNSVYRNWDENPWIWVVEFERVK